MAFRFPGEDWLEAAKKAINTSIAYRDAAATWEGDILFVITAIPGEDPSAQLYMDLWHGECRDAFVVKNGTSTETAFAITGPLPVWRRVLEGKLDPIRALVSRQLRIKGNMMKIMKTPRAAVELVNACATVDTSWPE